MTDWRPGASFEMLARRAQLLRQARDFFLRRSVLEVETPTLGSASVTDPHLHSMVLPAAGGSGESRFLQTSPEYFMKRMLAAGSGPIYQIARVYRASELGRLHNPEFSMLEWYRPGFDLGQLMDEVEALISELLAVKSIPRLSYREVFEEHLCVDPHRLDGIALRELALSRLDISGERLDDSDYLQLLMSQCIEPRLPAYCFVFDYPVAQAALATLATDANGQLVAKRFELYGGGMELANGYQELTDVAEQRARFKSDLQRREELGAAAIALDERLLAAMEAGLPDCAGVAVGFDRLLMLATGASRIEEVLSFSFERS